AVQQQIADLEEARLFGKLVDRIAAVQQHAGVPVDVGDLALAARGGGEAGVEGEDVGGPVELSHVDHVRTHRPLEDGKFDVLRADAHVRRITHTHPSLD